MPDTLPSTQEHLDIVDIVDRYVILKTGACAVIRPSPVNFDLLSEREQDAMINTFAGLLNSLTFPIQVIVRTRQTDVTEYLEKLQNAVQKQSNPFLKERIVDYHDYIERLTSRKDVLDKKFYVVVPYRDNTLNTEKKSINPFSKKRTYSKTKVNQVLERARDQLNPKIDHIAGQLSRLGVHVSVLEEKELVELYYRIYNPTVSRSEHITVSVDDYTAPFVEPAYEGDK